MAASPMILFPCINTLFTVNDTPQFQFDHPSGIFACDDLSGGKGVLYAGSDFYRLNRIISRNF
jgi:hypothetical protein